jgi:hypothetical protein
MTDVADGQIVEQAGPSAEQRTAAVGDESFALAIRQDATAIVRRPADVMHGAIEAAQALIAAISKKKNKVMMNNEQYIEVDDWEMVAGFHGCTPKLESDEYVEYGEAHGWEATVVLIARDGREVGRATMMCLDDEEKWSDRAKYEWVNLLKPGYEKFASVTTEDGRKFARRSDNAPNDALVWEDTGQPDPNRAGRNKSKPKSERILVGTERVPQFQLRSMAQTRAVGKVCRMVFGYVPMLAGLKATPAEELPDVEYVPNDPRPPAAPPQQQAARPPASGSNGHGRATPPAHADPPAVTSSSKISNAQVKAFWAWVNTQGVGVEDVATRIRTKYGHAQSSDLTVAELDELKAWVKDPDGDVPTTELEPGSEG